MPFNREQTISLRANLRVSICLDECLYVLLLCKARASNSSSSRELRQEVEGIRLRYKGINLEDK